MLESKGLNKKYKNLPCTPDELKEWEYLVLYYEQVL